VWEQDWIRGMSPRRRRVVLKCMGRIILHPVPECQC
jgi:hypothetical protein